ncbi:MAG: hypothetical protein WCK95_24385, partial [Alphaproteobacteria bacterium]
SRSTLNSSLRMGSSSSRAGTGRARPRARDRRDFNASGPSDKQRANSAKVAGRETFLKQSAADASIYSKRRCQTNRWLA